MVLTPQVIIGFLISLTSLVFNIFQFYKKRIENKNFEKEKDRFVFTLESIYDNLSNGENVLKNLSNENADSKLMSSNFYTIIETIKISISGYLKQNKNRSDVKSPTSFQELIEGVDIITNAMIKAVNNAQGYIFIVGGRSRNDKYLTALSKRIKKGDVRYVRVITGDHIRKQLHEHLNEVWDNIEIGYLEEDKYGGIIATHDTVIIALQSSKVSALDKVLLVKNEAVASDYRIHIQALLSDSHRNKDKNFFKELCLNC